MSDTPATPPSAPSIPYGLLLGIPLAAVVLMGAFSYRQIHTLQDELAQRPPIAVLPLDKLLTANGTDAANVDRQAERVRELAQKLKERGYIVLDDHRLVAYPGTVEVKP